MFGRLLKGSVNFILGLRSRSGVLGSTVREWVERLGWYDDGGEESNSSSVCP